MKRIIKIVLLLIFIIVQVEAKKSVKKNRGKRALIRGLMFEGVDVLPPGTNIDDLDEDDYDYFLELLERDDEEIASMTVEEEQKAFVTVQKQMKDYLSNKQRIKKPKNKKNKKNKESQEKKDEDGFIIQDAGPQKVQEKIDDFVGLLADDKEIALVFPEQKPVVEPLTITAISEEQDEAQQAHQEQGAQEPEVEESELQEPEIEDQDFDYKDSQEAFYDANINASVRETVRNVMQEMFTKMAGALDDRLSEKVAPIERNDFFDYTQLISPVVPQPSYQPIDEGYPWTDITEENPEFHLLPEKTLTDQKNDSRNYRQKKRQQSVARRKKNSAEQQAADQQEKRTIRRKVAVERALNTTASTDSGPMLINAATFAQRNRFYIAPAPADGSATDAVDARSFSFAQIKQNADNTGQEVFIQSLAPAGTAVQVNGVDVTPNPLQGKAIGVVTLVGKDLLPAVVLAGNPAQLANTDPTLPPTTRNDNGAAVYLLTQTDGTQLHSNVGNESLPNLSGGTFMDDALICDANNNAINQQIVALAGSKSLTLNNSYVFAAVPDGSYTGFVLPGTPKQVEKKIEGFLIAAGAAVQAALASATTAQGIVNTLVGIKPFKEAMVQIFRKTNFQPDVEAIVAAAVETATGTIAKIVFDNSGTFGGGFSAQDVSDGINATLITSIAQATDLPTAISSIDVSANTKLAGATALINAMLGWAIHEMRAQTLIPVNSVKPWKSAEIPDTDGVMSRYGDGHTSIEPAEAKYRGIAVLKNNAGNLTIWNNENQDTTFTPPTPLTPGKDRYAAYLNTVAQNDMTLTGTDIAFYAPGDANPITHAVLGSGIDMFWDEPLQRLYVGLSDVTRGGQTGAVSNLSGGVCSVLMGKWSKNNGDTRSIFSLNPVIKNVSSYLFQDNITATPSPASQDKDHFKDYIFGFYLNGKNMPLGASNSVVTNTPDDNLIASAKKVRVMHTSTGLDYLIVNGGVATEATKAAVNAQVYAVPLVGTGDDKGYVAQKNISLSSSNQFTTAVDLNLLLPAVVAKVKEGVQAVVDASGATNNIQTAATKIAASSATLQAIASVIVANMSSPDATAAVGGVFSIVTNETLSPVIQNAITAEKSGLTVGAVKALFDQNKVNTVVTQTSAAGAATGLVTGATNSAAAGIALAIEGGLVWGVNQFYASTRAQMLTQIQNTPRATDPAAAVGTTQTPLAVNLPAHAKTTGGIQDMQILGDTVLVSMAGARDATHVDDNGIFASTALFGSDGRITGWTPWERMLGRVEGVGAFGIDTDSSNIWFTTTKDGKFDITKTATQFNQVKVTNWGTGDVALHTPAAAASTGPAAAAAPLRAITRPAAAAAGTAPSATPSTTLQSAIDPLFVNVPGGILHLQNFGPDVNGFKAGNVYDNFSMMVATGTSQVALIQMGAFDATSNTFLPTVQFTAGQNVFMIDSTTAAGKVLGNIGEITCVELSRLPLNNTPGMTNQGWLFVAGTGGTAVLTRADGRGWDTSLNGGLSQLQDASNAENFPFGSRWQFLQLKLKDSAGTVSNPFGFVRKIISDQDKFLYIMTATEVWRVAMAQANFKRGSGSTTNEIYLNRDSAVKVASIKGSNFAGANPAIVHGDEFYDMMVINRDKSATGVNPTPNYTSNLLLASSKGLFVNLAGNGIPDGYDGVTGTKIDTISWAPVLVGTASLGPVLLLELVSGQPGDKMVKYGTPGAGQYAPLGNVYATAYNNQGGTADPQFLAVYRFFVGDGKVTSVIENFQEVTATGAPKTPYFYKIGTLSDIDKGNADDEYLGARDFSLRTKLVAGSKTDFGNDVPMLLTSQNFVRDSLGSLEAIDLNRDVILPLYLGSIVKDSASGAQYIAGEFGIRVNE